MFLFMFCADAALATVALGAIYLQKLPQPWLRAVVLHLCGTCGRKPWGNQSELGLLVFMCEKLLQK